MVIAAGKDDSSMVARQLIEWLVLLFGCGSSLLDSDSGRGLRCSIWRLGVRSSRDLRLEPRKRERIWLVLEFEGEDN